MPPAHACATCVIHAVHFCTCVCLLRAAAPLHMRARYLTISWWAVRTHAHNGSACHFQHACHRFGTTALTIHTIYAKLSSIRSSPSLSFLTVRIPDPDLTIPHLTPIPTHKFAKKRGFVDILGLVYFLYLFLFSGLEYTLGFLVHQHFHFSRYLSGLQRREGVLLAGKTQLSAFPAKASREDAKTHDCNQPLSAEVVFQPVWTGSGLPVVELKNSSVYQLHVRRTHIEPLGNNLETCHWLSAKRLPNTTENDLITGLQAFCEGSFASHKAPHWRTISIHFCASRSGVTFLDSIQLCLSAVTPILCFLVFSLEQGKMFFFIGVTMAVIQGGYTRRITPGAELRMVKIVSVLLAPLISLLRRCSK
ncbi:Major facilitator superfamily domain-containing protein 10, partial [Ophiophagus hannah]